jgi:hypothetical protein
MATVDAMRVANKEMKKQYKGIDIDKIEVGQGSFRHGVSASCWLDLLVPHCETRSMLMMALQSIHYDMEDLIEQANEIQESLSRTYGVPDEVDEADLQAGERRAATSRPSSQMRGMRNADVAQNSMRSDWTTSWSGRARRQVISRTQRPCPTLWMPHP